MQYNKHLWKAAVLGAIVSGSLSTARVRKRSRPAPRRSNRLYEDQGPICPEGLKRAVYTHLRQTASQLEQSRVVGARITRLSSWRLQMVSAAQSSWMCLPGIGALRAKRCEFSCIAGRAMQC